MSLGKHFINGVEDPVERALRSLLRQNKSLRLINSEKVLYKTQFQPKVVLLSGGGSGHEPAHAGYLGDGMLDVCVAGNIFASPSASQVLAGLKVLESPLGVLMIVKNYTGDKLNFGLAAQKAKAEGINVNAVFVGDDISVQGNDLVGRRGLAGVVFVHKVAGALSSKGASLEEVTATAQSVADNVYTVGVSLDRCSVPNRGKQESLPSENLEYGMGIHNEPGVRREAIPPLPTAVKNVLEFFEPFISKLSTSFAVMINNLGGLSVLELNVIAEEVTTQLLAMGISIHRVLIGTFVTSLDGPGFSVTILKLLPGFEELLNATTNAPAWPNLEVVGNVNGIVERTQKSLLSSPVEDNDTNPIFQIQSDELTKIVQAVVDKVTLEEPQITKFDTIAGDGDCGETLLKGVKAVRDALAVCETGSSDVANVFRRISTAVENSMGGTSGAIYAIFTNAVTNSLSNAIPAKGYPSPACRLISQALSEGLSELCKYTTARKGHKTLMDALIPFVEEFEQSLDFNKAIQLATLEANNTKHLDAVLGRASYVSKEHIEREGGVPDPGAIGIVAILCGIQNGLLDV